MNLFDILDNSIIIAPNIYKDYILTNINNKSNIKIIDLNEIKISCYFDFDFKAIDYIVKNYDKSIANAIEIMNTIYFVLSSNFSNEKTDELRSIYESLKKNNLLYINDYYPYLFKNKHVYIFGYDKELKELKQVLLTISKVIPLDYTYLDNSFECFNHNLKKFKDKEEELTFVFNQISSLLENNVSLSDIFIYSNDSSYDLLLEKFSKLYNIPLEKKILLFELPIFKKYISYFLESSQNEAFLKIQEENDPFNVITKLKDIIISLSNLELSKDDYIAYISSIAKSCKVQVNTKQHLLVLSNYRLIKNNQYVFMIGFTDQVYPKIFSDVGYLSDYELTSLLHNDSYELSNIEKRELISFITRTKNLELSYPNSSGSLTLNPSDIINELSLPIIDVNPLLEDDSKNVIYSLSHSKLLCGIAYDNERIFGQDSPYLNSYKKDDIKYLAYDYHYKQINSEYLNKLSLSFTSIDCYTSCSFKYFCQYILKINDYEEKFNTIIGDYFHLILKESLNENFNFDEATKDVSCYFSNPKDLMLATNLLKTLKKVVLKNDYLHKHTSFTTIYPEIEIKVVIDDNTTLEGTIDKLMIDEKDKLFAIVDYKTYVKQFEAKNINMGKDLQIPIYAYLALNGLDNEYKKYHLFGLLYQHILPLPKQLLDIKNFSLLSGVLLNDAKKVKSFINIEEGESEPLYQKFLKGVSFTKNGLRTNSMILSQEAIDGLSDKAKEMVDKVIKNIRTMSYTINPIKESAFTNSCNYCSYKDICFRKSSDFISLVGNDLEEE